MRSTYAKPRSRSPWRLLLGFFIFLVTCNYFRGRNTSDSSSSDVVLEGDQRIGAALGHPKCPAYGAGEHPSVAFLHIPKTAGMLLVETLADVMPQQGPGRWCTRGEPPKDLPEVYSTCSPGPLPAEHAHLFEATKRQFPLECSGFAAHQDAAFFEAVGVDPSRTITPVSLRHPVDRVISDYYYSLKQDAVWLEPYKPQNDSDFTGLQRFVEENREMLNNIGTQMVGGARHCEWPGAAPNTPMDLVLRQAKRQLEQTCVILITEYMEESMRQLARAAGWSDAKLLHVAHEEEAKSKGAAGLKVNATPRPHVPWEVRQVIAQHNQLDMQLYEHAVQLFLRRKL